MDLESKRNLRQNCPSKLYLKSPADFEVDICPDSITFQQHRTFASTSAEAQFCDGSSAKDPDISSAHTRSTSFTPCNGRTNLSMTSIVWREEWLKFDSSLERNKPQLRPKHTFRDHRQAENCSSLIKFNCPCPYASINMPVALIAQSDLSARSSTSGKMQRSAGVPHLVFRGNPFGDILSITSNSQHLNPSTKEKRCSFYRNCFQVPHVSYICPIKLTEPPGPRKQCPKNRHKKSLYPTQFSWLRSPPSLLSSPPFSSMSTPTTTISLSSLSSSSTTAVKCGRTPAEHFSVQYCIILLVNYVRNRLRVASPFADDKFLKWFLLLMLLSFKASSAILLSGAPDSYARYPKWMHTFENQLSLDFRTKQNNALLLYVDDGGAQGNFYSLTIASGKLQLDFRLGDESNDLSSERPVTTMRMNDVTVSDYRWHRLTLFQAWENVKLQLDDAVLFKILNQHSFVFGNLKTSSDIFVGGVPKDIHLLGAMSSPLKRHTKTFAGGVKNLLYRLYPQGVTSPQLIESVGMRQSDDDYCKPTNIAGIEGNFCKNDGICYSTNEGPKCDCSFTDFEGRRCEQARVDSELSFFGQEWIGYDVSNNSAAVIRSREENITLSFKTVHGKALLYIGGDRLNYVHITLDDGAVVATSKFDGTEKRLIRILNEYTSGRYDDDQWHTVTVIRTLTLMTLSVDGLKDEIRQYAPEVDWLVNSFAYVGGMAKDKNIPDAKAENFRGCMKKIKYEADAYSINFIALADQGYGQSVIRSAGDLAFSCRKPVLPADVLSFNSGHHFITLPKWNSMASGSLGFQLRTQEPDGLILYHGSLPTAKTGLDYIAFELVDGHLFMIINLGSGHVRLQTTATKITEGTVWHSVTLERMGRMGTVIVDNMKTDFSTPGVSANLIIEESIYLGGVPWPANESSAVEFRVPSPVWTANLRKGYIGCLKNVRINGISAKIASIFGEQQDYVKEGISHGCPAKVNQDFCAASPCRNFGRCENGYTNFRCDCSVSTMEGPLCDTEPDFVDFSMDDVPSLLLPSPIESEAETIECKFRSSDERGILLDTKSMKSSNHRILLLLIRGELELHLNFGDSRHTFNWGTDLNDDRIHSVRVKRRGEKLLLFLDGKWEHSYFLPSSKVVLDIDEIAAGQSLHANSTPDFTGSANTTAREKFRGQMLKMLFNDYDVLKNAKRMTSVGSQSLKTSETREGLKTKSRKAKYSSVSFQNHNAYVVINEERLTGIESVYRISFKFRTLSPSSIILAFATNSTYHGDYAFLELHSGRIRYTYGFGSRIETVMSSAMPEGQVLNDLKWHNVLVHQSTVGGEHYLVVDNSSTVMDGVQGHVVKLDTRLYIGTLPTGVHISPRLKDVSGFRGCISSLRLGSDYLDIVKDAEESFGVVKGCPGPQIRCSPKACSNRGKCIQKWESIKCDCSMTTYGGERCDSPGTTYIFDSVMSAIYYEFPQSTRPSTNQDDVAIGFRTRQATAVLLSVQCSVDGDFFTIFLKGGRLHVRFNLGSRDHDIGFLGALLNDDIHHAVVIHRKEANLTLYVDDRKPLFYTPLGGEIELVTLNMQWRVTVGASFNLLHRAKRRKRDRIYDAYNGFISGVNFNGLMILDMLAQGSPHVHRIGSPRLVHMSSRSDLSHRSKSLLEDDPDNEDSSVISGWRATSEEGLIQAEGSGCVQFEEQEKCQIADPDHTGLITPVLPISRVAVVAVEQSSSPSTLLATSEAAASAAVVSTTTALSTAQVLAEQQFGEEEQQTAVNGAPQLHYKPQRVFIVATSSTPRHRTRTTLAGHTIYAVRPTTPMGELITSTAKAPTAPTDFPRTALISIASLSVIIIIAIVVFCVFRCRQSGPSTDQYPMVCNGKQSGYAPIPAEMSPPMAHQEPSGQQHGPFFQNRVNQLNGYQPIKGAVIPNGNSPAGSTKGNGASTNGRKREFKEWYV